jgi:hypothetical protein
MHQELHELCRAAFATGPLTLYAKSAHYRGILFANQ